jgi:tRNA nucleotidyltransferase (CCA-adding enzyme)
VHSTDEVLQFLRELFPESCHDRLFLVGGSVRDLLLGRPARDIDLAALVADDQLEALGFRRVIGRTTAPVWFRHDERFGNIELTSVTADEGFDADLKRRDFTINAMSMELTGELHDPLGGVDDLRNNILKACSATVFNDDPLRIFRAFRFEAEGWTMDAATRQQLTQRDWSQPLEGIPVERFSRELFRALGSADPARFFTLMLEYPCSAVFLPEIFRYPRIPAGPLIHHPEGDLFTHCLQVLQRVALLTPDPLTRFCAFFHDIGKLATDPAHYPKHHGHNESGESLATELCTRLCLPARYGVALAWVSRLHGTFNRWDELRDATKVTMAVQAVKAGITDILPLVSAADKPGGTVPRQWKKASEIASMSSRELGIDQEQLESMPVTARSAHIHQKRVEMFRDSASGENRGN